MSSGATVVLAEALASLVGQGMESGRRDVRGPNVQVADVVTALNQFQECVRYLNTRRSKGAVVNLESEGDVQDVLYLMLRPWVIDLVPETPAAKVASRSVIRDFHSPSMGMVIEAKYIRDKRHGREITKEIHDDIEMYGAEGSCRDLVFFVYDPNALIPDVHALVSQVMRGRQYAGRRLAVHCVVKP